MTLTIIKIKFVVDLHLAIVKNSLIIVVHEIDCIIYSWFNDVMFQDGFQDILSQPLVDRALFIMAVSYGEIYQVVLDIMLGQSF